MPRRQSIRELVVELIRSYYKERGRDTFSYNDLRRFYYGAYPREKRFADWHSIERILRLLASEGLLFRHYPSPRKVLFIISPALVRR
ncbi:hypothetical protein DRP04_06090 [Archaeoglobales archaeon]|nr:MAG: hypothetical protein DRP04_06090 [Archaeoglobales archaeon]